MKTEEISYPSKNSWCKIGWCKVCQLKVGKNKMCPHGHSEYISIDIRGNESYRDYKPNETCLECTKMNPQQKGEYQRELCKKNKMELAEVGLEEITIENL